MLKAKPLEFFGFVGLTEAYAKSVELINDYYGLSLAVLEKNRNEKQKLTTTNLSKETLELINAENQEDILLYKKAKDLFQQRVKYFENQKPYTHILIQEKTEKIIRGCAFSKYTDKAISIDIYENEKIISTCKAKDFRSGLIHHKLPRDGFVVFSHMFSENIKNITFKISPHD